MFVSLSGEALCGKDFCFCTIIIITDKILTPLGTEDSTDLDSTVNQSTIKIHIISPRINYQTQSYSTYEFLTLHRGFLSWSTSSSCHMMILVPALCVLVQAGEGCVSGVIETVTGSCGVAAAQPGADEHCGLCACGTKPVLCLSVSQDTCTLRSDGTLPCNFLSPPASVVLLPYTVFLCLRTPSKSV